MPHDSDVADITVCIFTDGQGSTAKAVPGHAVVRRGQTILWENLTDHDLRLAFPDADMIFDNGMGQALRVEAGKSSPAVRIRDDAPRGGHPYMGVCQHRGRSGMCVEGGSHPVMIIR